MKKHVNIGLLHLEKKSKVVDSSIKCPLTQMYFNSIKLIYTVSAIYLDIYQKKKKGINN